MARRPAVLPGMVRRAAGSIVNLASVEGIEGGQSQTAYNASKGGVVLLTRSMAVDYGPHNVRVNCLCPGMIQTPMTAPLQDSGLRPCSTGSRAQHLLGRCGQPEEVAACRAVPGLRRRVVRDRPRPRRRRRLPRRPPLPRVAVRPQTDASVHAHPCVTDAGSGAYHGCWLLTEMISPVMYDARSRREEDDHVRDLPRFGRAPERLARS